MIPEDGRIVVDDFAEDRYSRFRLISWWDQDLLRGARVMVVGAGALGNEIVKNLALLGVGHVLLVDCDRIECSNLSRSVLFSASDEGLPKAEVAAASASRINPDTHVLPLVGNVLCDVGLGAFRSVDLVICGLDNREARLWVNQCCWRVNRPWIDGAIEALQGVARVFLPPDGPCYECTMNETDRRMVSLRKSCALLSREQMLGGRVPTTPTVASVIAGIQCQEAVKLIHKRSGLPTLAGSGFFFNGLSFDSFVVNYQRRDDCISHETFQSVVETGWSVNGTSLREVLLRITEDLGRDAYLDLLRELVISFSCPQCHTTSPVFKQLERLKDADSRCPDCGNIRTPELARLISGDEPYLDLTLWELGVPPFDIICGRSADKQLCYEISGDRDSVMGEGS